METRVVNKRTYEGEGVYIGRPSRWGNPFVVGRDGERGECVELHRAWLWREIQSGRTTLEALAQLHGKTLICWCAPASCHGDTLARAAAWAYNEIRRQS